MPRLKLPKSSVMLENVPLSRSRLIHREQLCKAHSAARKYVVELELLYKEELLYPKSLLLSLPVQALLAWVPQLALIRQSPQSL